MILRNQDLDDIIYERVCGKVVAPIKLEDSCIEFAWLGKSCPNYPFGNDNLIPCRNLTREGYENYRCLSNRYIEEFIPFLDIATKEQKDSWNKLADKYSNIGIILLKGDESLKDKWLVKNWTEYVVESIWIYKQTENYNKAKLLIHNISEILNFQDKYNTQALPYIDYVNMFIRNLLGPRQFVE